MAATAQLQTTPTRLFASPLARRIAEQRGVDLRLIVGTGPSGRIVRADVEGFTPQTARAPQMAMPATTAAPAPAQELGLYDAIPNSGMRKTIARRLLESKQTAPHFYLSVDCELDELLALRSKMNAATGAKLSVNDFVIRAAALALKEVPAANATWTDEAILQYRDADISVAVATPSGLITPIVRAAETKTLAAISGEMKDLAARAREGKLKPQEYQGGGFSISNLGMFGVKSFSAILNPPQAAILAVGAGEKRAVVKGEALAIATVMTCTLSVDHRAVDGAVGAQWLAAFKSLIESPYRLVS